MDRKNCVAFISDGEVFGVPEEKDIVELETHDQVLVSDGCTCTNKEHIYNCEIENVALEISAQKIRTRYAVEMAFCTECGAYYIPQKSYEYLESKGDFVHEIKGGAQLFKYLKRGAAFDEEKKTLENIERDLYAQYKDLPEPVSRYAIDDGCGGLYSLQGQKESSQWIYDMQDKINAMMQEPYVGRIDIAKAAGKGHDTYYIGKTEDTRIGNVFVYSSWSEIGRLFRKTTEESSTISGSKRLVDLRRRIDIRNQKLYGVEDQFLRNSIYAEKGIYDKFLIQVLMSRKKSHQLTDIIATIQDKQNEIIEKADVSNIIVQGCAGSGKTMVMLHRLSFWLYNDKSLKPEKIKILTPNENFNVHIGGLHSQLHLGHIEVMAVDQYYAMLLTKYDKSIAYKGKVDEEENIEERFLNYVYSKSFIKMMDKKYEEIISSYALPEELELLEECAKKCQLPFNISSRIPNGDKIRNIAGLAADIKAKNGSSYNEKNGYLNKIERLNDSCSNYQKAKQEAQKALQEMEKNYRKEIGIIIDQADSIVEERLESLDKQIESKEQVLHQLQRSILRVLNGAKIKSTENDINELREKRKEEEKRIKDALMEEKQKLDESESLDQAIVDLSLSEVLRDNVSVSAYVSSYRKLYRDITNQNNLLKRAIHQKEEIEVKLAITQELLDEKESAFIAEMCEKYPADIPLVIFNKCYSASISEKLHELEMEQPDKTYRCELYARVYFAEKFWNKTVGNEKLICIDEGQDVSYMEYERIIAQNKQSKAYYNIYGDLNQRIKQGRGLVTWEQIKRKLLATEYLLNENYRNTNQITQYCNEVFNYDMTLTGVEGSPVRNITFDEMVSELAEIYDSEERTAVILPRTMSKQRVTRARKLDKQKERLSVKFDVNKISIMYVDEIKGIEFDRVYVVDHDMEKNERYIAFTRALDNLTIVH